MQDKKINANENLSDKQLENVSGGEAIIGVHAHPHPYITCKCGHSFYAPYNSLEKYECPACKEMVFT
ncbi:MAG: hypothetical protein IJN21_08650 [Clostridia bacterium]|nr:hypothetical protein [Clostridiales bacterium]MBQ6716570.1 hypothetical protein [Clostridia bacterium]